MARGVQASPLGRLLAEKTGAEVDRAERLKVDPDLTILGHPELFVVGDVMSLDGLPGVAQVAIQSGGHAARTIARRVAGNATRQPFRYRDLGTMATISRFRALAVVGRIRGTGFGAWLVWTVAFLGRGRPQRVITAQQIFARRALEQQPGALPAVRAAGEAWCGAGEDGRSTQPETRNAHSHLKGIHP
jgi:NADH dehydrogenase